MAGILGDAEAGAENLVEARSGVNRGRGLLSPENIEFFA